MGIFIQQHENHSYINIVHTNFNHYLETTQRKQREIIIGGKSQSARKSILFMNIFIILKSHYK